MTAEEERAAVVAKPVISSWLSLQNAPRDGSEIIVVLGATIPDGLDIRAATYLSGDEADEMGWREYAKYGAWMIWNDGCDWFLVDEAHPLGWLPLPKNFPPQNAVIDQFSADAMSAAIEARAHLRGEGE